MESSTEAAAVRRRAAIYVAADGVLAWPTIGLTAGEISENLDPEAPQAVALSRDGLHAPGHWLPAGLGALAAVSACVGMIAGPEAIGAGAVLLWGIAVGVVFLIGLKRVPGGEVT